MTEKIFSNEVAVITGAGQGIGFEIARQLCVHGASVVLNDMDELLAKKANDKIQSEGGRCIPFPGDASDAVLVHALVSKAVEHYGKLSIAIANAGITLFGDFFDYKKEHLEQVMKVNMGGSFLLAQAASVQMRDQHSGGSILLMSSVTGHQSHKNLAAYSMTKAAIEMLAKSLVLELSPYKISINAIAPGATITERTTGDPSYERTWSEITPMGRPATVADIANAALFLVSPTSRHITGQTIIIDGGWTSVSPSPF